MKEESLVKALNVIVDALDKDKSIDSLDKLELLLNFKTLLDPDKYADNIDLLRSGYEKCGNTYVLKRPNNHRNI